MTSVQPSYFQIKIKLSSDDTQVLEIHKNDCLLHTTHTFVNYVYSYDKTVYVLRTEDNGILAEGTG